MNKEEEKAKNGFLPLMYSELNDELRLKAKKELNETDSARSQGLDDLRSLLKVEGFHSKFPDSFLLPFLRVAKFDVKKAHQRLSHYCSIRKLRYFTDRLDENRVLNVLDRNIVGLMPFRDKQGRAIVYVVAHAWSPDICDIEDLAVCLFALLHFVLSFPATSISGINLLTDSNVNYPSHHFSYMNLMKNHLSVLMSSPLRLQRLDLNNVNAFCRFCYNALSPLLPKKITKRVHLHGNCGPSITKVYPKCILPSEFGGTLGAINNAHFIEPLKLFIKELKASDCLF